MVPRWALILLVTCAGTIQTAGECPHTCECKWKSGKESVLCGGRNLSSLPQYLDSGTQLLDMSGNNLTSIRQDEFFTAALINLQKVFLSRCSLRTLHRTSFRNLKNLVDLDLSYNLLTTIPFHTFEFIPELMELKLNGNPIGAIRNNTFKSLSHLSKIDLSECRISYIEVDAFCGLEGSLAWLKLDKNRITNVKPATFMILANLNGLELAGNSWNCSCALRPLREWVLRHNIPHTVSPSCRYPERLADKLWDKLDLDEFACLPRVTIPKTEQRGVEGNNVTLNCPMRSSPTPLIRWLKRDRVIANMSGLANGRHIFTIQQSPVGSNLTITSAELGDSGEYICRVENRAGKAEGRISLSISLKPEEPVWSTKVVIATTAVVILFSLAAVLLLICICCLLKRQTRFHQHRGAARGDTYELNHKASKTYDKVIRNSPINKIEDPAGHDRDCRNGYLGGSENDSHSPAVGKEQTWGASTAIEKSEESPHKSELHIPILGNFRCDDDVKLNENIPVPPQLPGIATHVLHKEVRGPNGAMLYTSCNDTDNYPDLLETDKNTIPRRGYRQRRTRTGSCGSESMSPLLQGSSDESCDSTPIPLLDIPDPYPELDKFLKEYRNLQEQLYRMKESCENLKQDNLRFKAESSTTEPKTISRLMDNVYKTTDIEPMYSIYNTTAVEPLYSATQHLLNDSLSNVLASSAAAEQNNNPLSDIKSVNLKPDSCWYTSSKLLNNLTDPTPKNSYYNS